MKNEYSGMTVNERLYASGQIGEFDKAVEDQDVDEDRSILRRVGLTEESIEPILKQLGLGSKGSDDRQGVSG